MFGLDLLQSKPNRFYSTNSIYIISLNQTGSTILILFILYVFLQTNTMHIDADTVFTVVEVTHK